MARLRERITLLRPVIGEPDARGKPGSSPDFRAVAIALLSCIP
jgi:hypothetical protein